MDGLSVLSPSLPFAVMGLSWVSKIKEFCGHYYCEDKWTIKPGTYTAEVVRGLRKLDALFKIIYSVDELKMIKNCMDEDQ